jgi:hypothetical protein
MLANLATQMFPGKTPLQALADTPVASLLAQCQRAERAGRLINAALGEAGFPGGPPVLNCQFKEQVLIVFAHSAAQATKLRQAIPRCLAALREQGMYLSEIRIRVQPVRLTQTKDSAAQTGPDVPASDRDIQSRSQQLKPARAFAEKLALTLRPSPLRDAALRLASRLQEPK